MEKTRGIQINSKSITLEFEHNPYQMEIFSPRKGLGKTILFPIFHYQSVKQYIDLIEPLVTRGYKVITISLLNRGDRVLFFNYYYTAFAALLDDIASKKIIGRDKEEIILMGIGVGANLASYCNFIKTETFTISKIILISPVNRYKGEYRISREIANFHIPTYVFYGQFDKFTDVNTRYQVFQGGRDNPNVHFSCYPATGHFLYYNGPLSMELEKLYRNSDYDVLVGQTRRNKNPFLPSESQLNKTFFNHLFNIIEDVPNPKRVGLLIDVFPLFINGVDTVVGMLKRELEKLGYETYVIALWKKYTDFNLLPDNYIPVIASYARMIKGHEDLSMLKTFKYQYNAKMLAMFGFDYLHLHTEYSISRVAIRLAKMTGINMPYTFHTLWKQYYKSRFGSFIGKITYGAAKLLLFNHIYKACPVIVVPSQKSYDVLANESKKDGRPHKDVRIIPSPIDTSRFILEKPDREKIAKLKLQYHLKGKKVLGYVGRVSLEKNITETLYNLSQVVGEIPNLVFMIVGSGDAVATLQKCAKKLNIEDHVIFVGQIPNEELKLYYSLFDVFVTASNFETQGITYFEAAASGTLILAKKDKALEGVFEDGVNAYCYSDLYQWVERIEKALFGDNYRIIENARQTMKKYTPDKWGKSMLKIYQELNPEK